MSKITITIRAESKLGITQIFSKKKLGSSRNVLIAALKWLTSGTEFEEDILLMVS